MTPHEAFVDWSMTYVIIGLGILAAVVVTAIAVVVVKTQRDK